MNPYYDPSKPHHRPDGFQNRNSEIVPRGRADVLRWKWNAARKSLPPPHLTPTPRVAPDLAFLQPNAVELDWWRTDSYAAAKGDQAAPAEMPGGRTP